jgi:hypothetical protein
VKSFLMWAIWLKREAIIFGEMKMGFLNTFCPRSQLSLYHSYLVLLFGVDSFWILSVPYTLGLNFYPSVFLFIILLFTFLSFFFLFSKSTTLVFSLYLGCAPFRRFPTSFFLDQIRKNKLSRIIQMVTIET